MNKEQIDEIALRVAKDRYVAQHSGTGEGINFANYAEFTHALLAELAKVQEPFGYYENGRWSIVTDGGPDKWRARKEYTGPLYTHQAPSVPEWQPIETAPMLKAVLLAVEFDGPGDWCIKCGSFYSNEWHVWGASWKPTHWMPLPKPPVSAAWSE